MNNLYKALITLFATLEVYKQKLHNYHWHSNGPLFYQTHLLFDRLYEALQEFEDRLAEHIRGYGRTPGLLADYLILSSIDEDRDLPSPEIMIENALKDLELIRKDLSSANEFADLAKKKGTLNLLGELDETLDSFFYLLSSNTSGFNVK